MAYTAWSVVFGEQPTAAKWNQLGENDAGFKDGTNIDDSAIIERHIGANQVTAGKLGQHSAMGVLDISTTGNKSVSGLDFEPSSVFFIGARTTSASFFGMGFGFMTAALERAYGGQIQTGSGGVAGTLSSSRAFLYASESGTTIVDVDRVSLNSDGFTVNVLSASSAIPDLIYLAHV